MPEFSVIHHLNLSVTDLARSAAWYTEALGLSHGWEMEDQEGRGGKVVLLHPTGPFRLVLSRHRANDGEEASEFRTGLDHVAFTVADRAALETWPTEGNEAGILDLWIADKGRLGKGAGPWPLLHEGRVDVFTGVPIGRTQRGLVIHGLFFERNWLVGGRPGQGKTSLVRILVLGAGLDPTAEIWVFVIAQNTDFDPLAPRLSRYAVGMGPEVAAATVHALADLLTEMQRRGKLLATLPGSPPATSRRLADRDRIFRGRSRRGTGHLCRGRRADPGEPHAHSYRARGRDDGRRTARGI